MLNIERKITLVQDQNRVLRGILQSLFDHHFIFGGGSPRPLGDFVEYRNLDPVPGSGPVPGPAAGNGTAFHNLLLYPRQDLHPLFTGILAANPEFRTHAESCREHRGGKQRLNGELLMAFELTGPAKTPGETPFPSGCYREFNQTAGAAEKKFAANHAELRVLEQLRQSLFPPYGGV
jgi:hypothetical protein